MPQRLSGCRSRRRIYPGLHQRRESDVFQSEAQRGLRAFRHRESEHAVGGQMQSSFFGLVDGLMRLYDRRVGRATGSTPIKQHSNENVAETHAREQRKDYRIDISSIQSTTAGMLSTLFGYVLRAEGKKGEVMFYFENTPDPEDVKALAEAEGCQNRKPQEVERATRYGGHR